MARVSVSTTDGSGVVVEMDEDKLCEALHAREEFERPTGIITT
jgi:hypothetical protein